jgi:hypothetical protein
MSGSFFKNIAVTYWTAQIYNNTEEDMRAEIDEEFSSPLVDAASNYVCAVERMELSGNNIFFYNVNTDTDANLDTDGRKYVCIYFLNSDMSTVTAPYTLYLYGSYYSLGSLIDSLNYWCQVDDESLLLVPNPAPWLKFSLTGDGKIRVYLDSTLTTNKFGQNANGLVIAFSSAQLASIWGLPEDLTFLGLTPKTWFDTYSGYTPYDTQCFETLTSRIDCGIIPTMVHLRSSLPFESDQVSSAKTNIVTDFNIVPGSSSGYQITSGTNTTVSPGLALPMMQLKNSDLSLGCGGMLIYTPMERRWLNFSAPIAIYNIRLWIELIFNDPDTTLVYNIPPGGKFSIKLGLYLRD